MAMNREQAKTALGLILEAIIDAVKSTGNEGAPSGMIYAAMCDFVPAYAFQTIMAALVTAGELRRVGHVYYYVPRA